MNLNYPNIKFAIGGVLRRSKKAINLLVKFKKTIKYIYKNFGLGAAYNFIWVKLFIKEGGAAVSNPIFSVLPEFARFPRQIELEITTYCNLKCEFCEQKYWQEKPRHLTWEEFIHIISEFPHLRWIGLAGIGSNFMHPQFMDMLRYLKKKKIYVDFVDHLNNVNDAMLDEIVKIGVDNITISMDAYNKETYESLKVGASYDRVVNNIKKLIALKKKYNSPLPELQFRYILNKKNIEEAPLYLDFINSLGKAEDFLSGGRIEYVGLLNFKEIEDEYYLPEIPAHIIKQIDAKAKAYNIPIAFTHSGPKKRPRFMCAAWTEPFIFVTGHVIPCCATNEANERERQKAESMGNIFKQPMREIWRSKKYKELRKNVPKVGGPVPSYCQGCRIDQMG